MLDKRQTASYEQFFEIRKEIIRHKLTFYFKLR